MKSKKIFEKKKLSGGFTLVELMISVAIAVTIMAVVLWNYGTFNDNLALSAEEQNLAIALRQAQTYGLSVKEASASSGNFSFAYGIYISPSSPNDYILFVDRNADTIYNAGGTCGTAGSECVSDFKFRNNVKINKICDQSNNCSPASYSSVSISFLRPNPDAYIKFTDGSGGLVAGHAETGNITLISPKSKTAPVTVESTGQVYVQ